MIMTIPLSALSFFSIIIIVCLRKYLKSIRTRHIYAKKGTGLYLYSEFHFSGRFFFGCHVRVFSTARSLLHAFMLSHFIGRMPLTLGHCRLIIKGDSTCRVATCSKLSGRPCMESHICIGKMILFNMCHAKLHI